MKKHIQNLALAIFILGALFFGNYQAAHATEADCMRSGGTCAPFPGTGFDCVSNNWDHTIECDSDGNRRCCLPAADDGDYFEEDYDTSSRTTETYTSNYYSTGDYRPVATGTWNRAFQRVGVLSGLPQNDSENLLMGILHWLIIIFIILSFISFVVTGIMYLGAGANKNLADKAKTGVGYSLMALAVALGAFIIITLINNLLWGMV